MLMKTWYIFLKVLSNDGVSKKLARKNTLFLLYNFARITYTTMQNFRMVISESILLSMRGKHFWLLMDGHGETIVKSTERTSEPYKIWNNLHLILSVILMLEDRLCLVEENLQRLHFLVPDRMQHSHDLHFERH